ncbi:hypothetical protein SAMN04488109_3169 [Chryseolinea serpens]|uniref:Uncharacterized protein n=1 Tax=Chryseolinea serpens TaxID=947013 RepID=A0A1M5R2Z3_9BACT|nr:hypothetical protein SAMN04488109_3169 [Chryseolinea serpens]
MQWWIAKGKDKKRYDEQRDEYYGHRASFHRFYASSSWRRLRFEKLVNWCNLTIPMTIFVNT